MTKFNQRCRHRSHSWRLRCFRYVTYQGQCWKHNRTCYTKCPSLDDDRDWVIW